MAKLGKESNVISHWHHPKPDFETSPVEFYAAVERQLQPLQIPGYSVRRIDWHEGGVLTARREYLRVQRGRVVFDICAAPFGTGFFFSSWLAELTSAWGLLWLLLIVIGGFIFTGIVMALFGAMDGISGGFVGMFFGAVGYAALLVFFGYLVRRGNIGFAIEDAILGIPFVGWIYDRVFSPETYYKLDSALMFQSMVLTVVQDEVDRLTSAKGVRALTETERKPIMRGFLGR